MSIRKQLVLSSLAIVLLPLLTFGPVIAWLSGQLKTARQEELIRAAREAFHKMAAGQRAARADVVAAISETMLVGVVRRSAMTALLERLSEQVDAIVVVERGRIIASAGVTGDVDTLAAYLAKHATGLMHLDGPLKSMSLRLPQDEGQWELADLKAGVDVFFRMRAESMLRPRVVITSHGRGVALWLKDGTVASTAEPVDESWEHRGAAQMLAEKLAERFAGTWPSVSGAGGQNIAMAGALMHVAASYDYPSFAEPDGASLVAVMEDTELYRGLDAAEMRIAGGLLIALIFAFSLAIVLARSYRRSIDVLETGISAVGRGEWTQLPTGGRNELGTDLVQSLNAAVQRASTRAKERDAETWAALLRNIAHEVNNTLAPIKSLAQGMEGRGAELIAERADALAGFVARCSELAKLPPPSLQRVDVGALIRAAVQTYAPFAAVRHVVINLDVETAWAAADPAQMERVLLNLVKNAIEAAHSEVRISVNVGDDIRVRISDDGEGLTPDAAKKLGTPFFTTKPTGTGLGFTLARQIVQAHGGDLLLENAARGAVATVAVPHA